MSIKKTPLYEAHLELRAKMVPFARFEMPVSYQTPIQEHRQVLDSCGVFDVSHMGRIQISGPDAGVFLEGLATNTLASKQVHSATYTLFCNENGGVIDDLIVLKEEPSLYSIIANSSNREKDLAHLKLQAKKFDVNITPLYEQEGILAVQGPAAKDCLEKIFSPGPLPQPMKISYGSFQGSTILISGTGYTGTLGYELFIPNTLLLPVWKALIDANAVPVGLAARDLLRLEMGYALYGHELSEEISALETVSAWTIKWQKETFLGKKALMQHRLESRRFPIGLVLKEPGVPREGYRLFKEGQFIGKVTSGTYSPVLSCGIALGLSDLPLQLGDSIQVEIRQRKVNAEIVSLPFVRRLK